MAKSRKFLTAGAIGVAAFALIGAGASATFTAHTTSTQTITAGVLAVSLSSPDVAGCHDATNHCTSLTLPAFGATSSTFETANSTITMTNTGTIPLSFDGNYAGTEGLGVQMTAAVNSTPASAYLRDQMNVCIQGGDASGSWVEGNGPLTTALALHPSVRENPVVLAVGGTATYNVNFYAGKNSAGCGTTTSSGPNTTAAWVAQQGHGYLTPASLTNEAMGGVVTPTLTWNFKE